MQDRYVGDIGDYCKFCLLRVLTDKKIGLGLAINWYKTLPDEDKARQQDDGKFIKYSDDLQDPTLHTMLNDLQTRTIEAIEEANIVKAKFYNIPVPKSQDRELWHLNALKKLRGKDLVFLDPDNGIETETMKAQKHVRLSEIEDYYTRGQSIIVYQHHPHNMKKDIFLKNIFQSQFKSMKPDAVRVVEYSRYNCRFFILLLHKEHRDAVDEALAAIKNKPSKFCKVYLRAEDCNSASPRSRRPSPQPK